MKFYDFSLFILLAIALSVSVIIIGNKCFPDIYSDDNPVEEVIEEEIEDITGVDIDLTPESKEQHYDTIVRPKILSSK